MNKKKIAISVFVLILVVLFLTWFASAKIVYADPAAAVTIGGRFFEKLKMQNEDEAFALYSDEFQYKEWMDFLTQIQVRYGPVASTALLDSVLVPINKTSCFALVYKIQRTTLATQEQLVVCPMPDDRMVIIGHEFTRLDTNQTVRAGQTVTIAGGKLP
ncbi:hypothetical protein [Massilia scottii]|uniref:hypothetical protein n=1 Tax=Massilia scottii TaxID=3057166 RepID=UPI0027967C3B|nr:hypothetical protein [Massilia sp. CCM 9029]MDQ1833388.1 hypothetical protein [Massilia sp. CCM 9029]